MYLYYPSSRGADSRFEISRFMGIGENDRFASRITKTPLVSCQLRAFSPQVYTSLKGCGLHNRFRNACSSEHLCFRTGAGWGACGSSPYSMSANIKRKVITYHTLLSLQICFLLSEKSMRRNPPPWTRTTFRGSRSPCIIPILWRSCTNLYTLALGEIMYNQREGTSIWLLLLAVLNRLARPTPSGCRRITQG